MIIFQDQEGKRIFWEVFYCKNYKFKKIRVYFDSLFDVKFRIIIKIDLVNYKNYNFNRMGFIIKYIFNLTILDIILRINVLFIKLDLNYVNNILIRNNL